MIRTGLLFFSLITQHFPKQNVLKTKVIYNNIIMSIGNSFPSPPKLNFSDKKDQQF